MSMQEAAAAASAAQGSADVNQVLGDQSFVSSVLSSVRTFCTVNFTSQFETEPHWLFYNIEGNISYQNFFLFLSTY